MQTLHIDVKRISTEQNHVEVDLETFLIINIFTLCTKNTSNVNLIVHHVNNLIEPTFLVRIDQEEKMSLENASDELITYAKHPVLLKKQADCNILVAGLCSIARQLLKRSQNVELLGFRESSLAACSESSIWTKFCEVDMIATVRQLALGFKSTIRKFPDDLIRFEYHMEQPVRIHNVYKLAREMQSDATISSSVPVKELNVPHTFSEGPSMTLSDLILWPLIEIAKSFFSDMKFRHSFPLTNQWLSRVATDCKDIFNFHLESIVQTRYEENDQFDDCFNPELKKQSLYTCDPSRFKPASRPFTKQNDIANALQLVDALVLSPTGLAYGGELDFDWNSIPISIRPEGALPQSRLQRKKQQLENLVKAVMKVCSLIDRRTKHVKIVDFCSGSGHLGLLLAHALPHCEVILVENKERSLQRAIERIQTLRMTNIVVVQANLDYFSATFDIGVALHACGVATDLVLQNCVRKEAHFVVCPCCYGGIHDCHRLKYPRSAMFRNCVRVGDYLNIAHAADQTHDKENAKTLQGYECMRIIDNDRLKYAEEHGFHVHLGKLIPDTCTPKNNLLVGILQHVL